MTRMLTTDQHNTHMRRQSNSMTIALQQVDDGAMPTHLDMRRIEKYIKTHGLWHTWFAWHPVRVNGNLVWLRTVGRKYQIELCRQYLPTYVNKVMPEYCTLEDITMHKIKGDSPMIRKFDRTWI